MALLRRNKSDQATGVSEVEFNQPSRRRWPLMLASLLAAMVLALALVFGGRWVYRTVTDNEPPPATPTNQQQNLPTQPGTSSSPPPSPTTPPPSPPPGRGSSPAPAPSPSTPPPSPGQLPNNGPGGVVALFAGTTLVATAIHYAISARRSFNF